MERKERPETTVAIMRQKDPIRRWDMPLQGDSLQSRTFAIYPEPIRAGWLSRLLTGGVFDTADATAMGLSENTAIAWISERGSKKNPKYTLHVAISVPNGDPAGKKKTHNYENPFSPQFGGHVFEFDGLRIAITSQQGAQNFDGNDICIVLRPNGGVDTGVPESVKGKEAVAVALTSDMTYIMHAKASMLNTQSSEFCNYVYDSSKGSFRIIQDVHAEKKE